METATILGVYDFIGFHLCHCLLEKGTRIVGINLNDCNAELMRLEIGRNANYEEISLSDWDAENVEGPLFISLFGVLQQTGEESKIEGFMTMLAGIRELNHPIIFIFPAWAMRIENVPPHLKKATIIEFYLPTIYGPWQPDCCFFQQWINYRQFAHALPVLGEWEWVDDAIYIDDVIELILAKAEGKAEGKYFARSGEVDQWVKCAEILVGDNTKIPPVELAERRGIPEGLEQVAVKQNESIHTGLTRQKQHSMSIRESGI